jgi:hypothetical protein
MLNSNLFICPLLGVVQDVPEILLKAFLLHPDVSIAALQKIVHPQQNRHTNA